MSWQLYRGCAECGAEHDRACRTPADQVALLPCRGRRLCESADRVVVRRWLAQRKRRAVLAGLLPASSGPAAAVVTNLLEATEAEGNNEPTFTSVKGQ
jgi:hypothetical protein